MSISEAELSRYQRELEISVVHSVLLGSVRIDVLQNCHKNF